MFLFFSVGRSAQAGQAERPTVAQGVPVQQPVATDGEKMPTDKILDVSPLALRMSSPFNASYWLAAA